MTRKAEVEQQLDRSENHGKIISISMENIVLILGNISKDMKELDIHINLHIGGIDINHSIPLDIRIY
jgi:hypothetical protein